jgi:hypothetical protein
MQLQQTCTVSITGAGRISLAYRTLVVECHPLDDE